jgi:predicted permease
MAWLKQWSRRRTAREELAEEMRQHLEEKAQALEEAGMSREDAWRAAQRSFGNAALLQDRGYAVWESKFLSPAMADLKFGLGQLRRSPIFTLTAVLTLATGIGANTAVFSLLYAVVLRNLPVPNPRQLAFVEIANPKVGARGAGISYPILQQLNKQQKSFSGVSGWSGDMVSIPDSEGTQRTMDGGLVTGNAFDVLGVRPALGRTLTPADDVPGGPAGGWPVMLTYDYWQQNYHGDTTVIGRRITVSELPGVIVGVLPEKFEGVFTGAPTKVFLPLHFVSLQGDRGGGSDPLTNPSAIMLDAIGRLKPGVTLAQANAEISSYSGALLGPAITPAMRERPFFKDATLRASSASHGMSELEGEYRRPLLLLQAIVGMVLLLCCVNVAGLQLARTYARRHEFAVRIALGAGRRRVIQQCLAEAFLLAIAGAVLAAIVSWFSTELLSGFLTTPGSGESTVIHPDFAVLAVTGGVALVATLAVGILPALLAGWTAPGSVLKVRSALGRRPNLAGKTLVSLQVALSFVLVVAATLFTNTLLHLRGEEMGFNANRVMEVCAQFQRLKKTPEELMVLYRQMVGQLRTEPGVQSAAITWVTPLTGFGPLADVHAIGGAAEEHRIAFNDVGPGYFDTLETALLRGRDFNDGDKDRSVCIVNQAAAKALFPGGQALDGNLNANFQTAFKAQCRIVGVVQDAKYANVREKPSATIYFPICADTVKRGGYDNNMVFLIRSGNDTSAMSAYRKTLAEFAPTTSYNEFLPLREQVDQAMGSERLLTLLSGIFGGVALLLSGIGIFGLLATRVEQRTAEIGIRLALGSTRRRVLGYIVREGLLLLGIGLAIGAPAVFYANRLMQRFLYETSVTDVHGVGTALLALSAVTVFAALLPGVRAARLDPMQALRQE